MRFPDSARLFLVVFLLLASLTPFTRAQAPADGPQVALQPLAQQVRQIESALSYLGQPLAEGDVRRINAAIGLEDESAAVPGLERVLDQSVLLN